jgi:hypothetical protein
LLFPEHLGLDHDQISRSEWSILALPKIQAYFRKTTPNRAVSIIDNSRTSFNQQRLLFDNLQTDNYSTTIHQEIARAAPPQDGQTIL